MIKKTDRQPEVPIPTVKTGVTIFPSSYIFSLKKQYLRLLPAGKKGTDLIPINDHENMPLMQIEFPGLVVMFDLPESNF